MNNGEPSDVLVEQARKESLRPATLSPHEIISELSHLEKSFEPVEHREILELLLKGIERTNFREQAGLTSEKETLQRKHYLVLCIEAVLEAAQLNNWGLCRNETFTYLFNGAFWALVDSGEFQNFLGSAAEKMGIDRYDAKLYAFREQLHRQFLATANLPKPAQGHKLSLIHI